MKKNISLGLAVLGASPLFQGVALERPVIAAACDCKVEGIRLIEERALRKVRRAIGNEGMALLSDIFLRDRQPAKRRGEFR